MWHSLVKSHSLVAFWAKTLDINDKPLLISSIVWSRAYISDIEFISHEVLFDIVSYRKIKYPHVGSECVSGSVGVEYIFCKNCTESTSESYKIQLELEFNQK